MLGEWKVAPLNWVVRNRATPRFGLGCALQEASVSLRVHTSTLFRCRPMMDAQHHHRQDSTRKAVLHGGLPLWSQPFCTATQRSRSLCRTYGAVVLYNSRASWCELSWLGLWFSTMIELAVKVGPPRKNEVFLHFGIQDSPYSFRMWSLHSCTIRTVTCEFRKLLGG